MLTRRDIENREHNALAPYASFASHGRGRRFPQPEHSLRTCFQRDRDRIVHSAAFRRLEYKTQVFIPHERDHFRTRLTHTIEVAQIGRTLARSLQLNEDLTEAIALVHDLGHTPFGHSGEDTLNELLSAQGGFNHNLQSLRVVEKLEQRYPEHPGLNLTYEVREGIARHETTKELDIVEFSGYAQPTLEASLVDIADEIAYNSHDIDDGLSSGYLNFEDLADLSLLQQIGDFTVLPAPIAHPDQKRYAVVRQLIDKMASDVIAETQARIDRAQVNSVDDIRMCSTKLCGYSAEMQTHVTELKMLLNTHLYRHPRLRDKSVKARQTIRVMFEYFLQSPTAMPRRFQEMLKTEDLETVVADYIAGMTDRYAEKVFDNLNSP